MTTQVIDWQASELRPVARKRRVQQETFYPVTCSTCGYTRKLRKSDALRAKSCRRCAAREGYRRAIAKVGPEAALGFVRAYRLGNPSSPERVVAGWLAAWDFEFEREVIYVEGSRGYILDFVLPGGCAVEINGYWHKTQRRSQERDALLRIAWHAGILFLDADDVIHRPALAKARLLSFALATVAVNPETKFYAL